MSGKSLKFKKPKRYVRAVFLHCSASDNPEHDDISVIDEWHRKRGFNLGCGYHYFIKKDGTIQAGRDLELIPAAQKGHNTGTIAICVHGLEEEKFTEHQFDALNYLCREIQSAYDRRIPFKPHNSVSAKACPVFDEKKQLGLDEEGFLREPRQTLSDSGTIKGCKVVGGAAILGQVTQSVDLVEISAQVGAGTSIVKTLSDFFPSWIWLVIILAGIGYIIWRRREDFKYGRR